MVFLLADCVVVRGYEMERGVEEEEEEDYYGVYVPDAEMPPPFSDERVELVEVIQEPGDSLVLPFGPDTPDLVPLEPDAPHPPRLGPDVVANVPPSVPVEPGGGGSPMGPAMQPEDAVPVQISVKGPVKAQQLTGQGKFAWMGRQKLVLVKKTSACITPSHHYYIAFFFTFGSICC